MRVLSHSNFNQVEPRPHHIHFFLLSLFCLEPSVTALHIAFSSPPFFSGRHSQTLATYKTHNACIVKDVSESRRCIVCIFFLTSLFSISCPCCPRADPLPSSHGPFSEGSYDQYPTEEGSVVIAKPVQRALANNPHFGDYLHVGVACLAALLLIILLGLFIRRNGVTLPAQTRYKRSKRLLSPAGDTESIAQSDTTSKV